MEDGKVKDPIAEVIGEMGLWQMAVFLTIDLVKFSVAWQQMAIIFLAAPVSYDCATPNVTDKCSPECTDIKYDTSVFESTIVTEWGLVCDKIHLANLTQTLVMTGVLVGSMTFGILADRYGRRYPFIASVMFELLSGLGSAFIKPFWIFCILKFLTGAFVGGTMVVSFVIIMELIGPRWRGLISVLYQIPFNIGHMTLGVFGYFIRNWRYFQLGITIPNAILIIYFWGVPESPRWLYATNNLDRATKVLERASKWNKSPPRDIRAHLESSYTAQFTAANPAKKGYTWDLFRTPNMRNKTIFMCFNWFSCGLAYFGTAQFTGSISGSIFINVILTGGIGIPGTLVCSFLVSWMGRKKTLIFAQLLSAAALLTIAALPADFTAWVVSACATAGMGGMSIAFPTVYLYAGELFPTVVRNQGIGLTSVIARIGSMAAPFLATYRHLGPAVFGIIALIAAVLVLFLPETLGQPLPETIQDGENFGKKE